MKNTHHLSVYSFTLISLISEINTPCWFWDPVLSTVIYVSINFVYFRLQLRINKQLKFGQFYTRAEIRWSVQCRLNEKQLRCFYFHPSKRDCFHFKGPCQHQGNIIKQASLNNVIKTWFPLTANSTTTTQKKRKQSDYVIEPWSAEGLEINVNDSLNQGSPKYWH